MANSNEPATSTAVVNKLILNVLIPLAVTALTGFFTIKATTAVLLDDVAEVVDALAELKKTTAALKTSQGITEAAVKRNERDIATTTADQRKHVDTHPNFALENRLVKVEARVEALEKE